MKLKQTRIASACVPLLLSLSIADALAQPVPGGSLDPLTIPKYVTPLVIPPVMFDDKGGKKPLNVEVALRQFDQQILPAGLFPATTVWGYGDPSNPSTFHNPSFTFEVTQDTLTTVTWKNELVDAAGGFLPHIITDVGGNPIIDQTLHWAAPNGSLTCDGLLVSDCAGITPEAGLPYTGPIPMVTHLHGAHVGPISDGYPEAWTLPAANNIPAGYATTGTFYDTALPAAAGSAVYQYTNDQPTATLWYHDHSLGITRLNVYAAGAGFWLIRDRHDRESGVPKQVKMGPGKPLNQNLPGPAPEYGINPNGTSQPERNARSRIREIPIAIQPKSFNTNGSQYYPADRAFFEGLGIGDTYADNTDVNIPFLPQTSSDISPVWNPEAFFNTMVVNGKTWPQLDVASERYRFRLLNASDSRFLNLALFEVVDAGPDGIMGTADDTLGAELPFYMIGAEQSQLPSVVRIQTGEAVTLPGDGTEPVAAPDPTNPTALLVGPAERADVIVDFSNLPAGTLIRMVNTAPDAPFGGFPDVPADLDTSGQIMQFMVDTGLNSNSGDKSTAPADLVLDPNPGGAPKLGPSSVTQDLALLEEESAKLCVTIDAVTGVIDLDANSVPPNCDPVLGSVPFGPMAAVLGVSGSTGGQPQMWDDFISTNPAVGATETWELWNHSADAHPIHLHLVKFEVVNREIIGGAVRPPEPWESGWKDTVIAYPGEVTRIKAQFDKAGLYVWHCHILSHEDNEMMVPYCVGTPGVDCPIELFPPVL